MAVPDSNKPQNEYTEQYMQNSSYDRDYNVLFRESVGFTGQGLQRETAIAMALKITNVGSVTYLALAAPGTAQSGAFWQCRKIDKTDGVVITWADGDANFDNVATDLTALSYS